MTYRRIMENKAHRPRVEIPFSKPHELNQVSTSLCLTFLICKLGKIVFTLSGCFQDKMNNICEHIVYNRHWEDGSLPFLLLTGKIKVSKTEWPLLGVKRIMIQWKFNMGFVQSKVVISLYPISHLNLHKNSTYLKGLLSLFYIWEKRVTYNFFKITKLLDFITESQT